MRRAIILLYIVATVAALIAAVSGVPEGSALATIVVWAAVGLALLPLIIWLADSKRRKAVSPIRLLGTYALIGIGTALSVLVFDGALAPTAVVMAAVGAMHAWIMGDLLGSKYAAARSRPGVPPAGEFSSR